MKILLCNSFYYQRGGAERCYFDLIDVLERNGHEVVPFAMHHPMNLPSKYSDYFISHIDFPTQMGNGSGLKAKLNAVGRVLYSREAHTNIQRLITDTKPDIAHIHGIAHETSPSILPALKKVGIPVVQTLHDYKLICPNTSFVSHNQICERCKGHRYYNVVRYRCKRGSMAGSLLAGVELYVHKLLQIYERNVDVFIAPSQFLEAKMKEHGIHNRIEHIPNAIQVDMFEPCYDPSDYFVFLGRLVDGKGVTTLFDALLDVPDANLHVIGDGELKNSLEAFATQNNLNVTFHGHQSRENLIPLLQNASFSILPSKWYENYPMTILESFACGTPVIGANSSGIAELIEHQTNGLLFEPNDAADLAQQIRWMLSNPSKIIRMGKSGRKQVEINNNLDTYYNRTVSLYNSLLEPVTT